MREATNYFQSHIMHSPGDSIKSNLFVAAHTIYLRLYKYIYVETIETTFVFRQVTAWPFFKFLFRCLPLGCIVSSHLLYCVTYDEYTARSLHGTHTQIAYVIGSIWKYNKHQNRTIYLFIFERKKI